jgi:hypothetical protein
MKARFRAGCAAAGVPQVAGRPLDESRIAPEHVADLIAASIYTIGLMRSSLATCGFASG